MESSCAFLYYRTQVIGSFSEVRLTKKNSKLLRYTKLPWKNKYGLYVASVRWNKILWELEYVVSVKCISQGMFVCIIGLQSKIHYFKFY